MTSDDQPTSPDPAQPSADDVSAAPETPPTRRTLRAAERTRRLAAERAAQLEARPGVDAESPTGSLPPLPPHPIGAPEGSANGGATPGSAAASESPVEAVADSGDAATASVPTASTTRDDVPMSDSHALTEPSTSSNHQPATTDPIAQILEVDHAPLDEAVRQPKPRRHGPRVATVAIILTAVLAVGGAIAVGWSFFGDRIVTLIGGESNDYEGSGNGNVVDFAILEGDTGTDIGNRLAEADIVKSSEAFVKAVLARPEEPQFMPGAYQMQQQQSAANALAILLDDSNRVENTVVIPEGTAMADIFTEVEHTVGIPVADLEAAAADPQSFGLPPEAKSLEGFLFPATYTFEPGIDAKGVLTTMVDRMFQALDEHGVPEDERWQTVVLASLVQREARLDDDFPKVARVFLNRIDDGMNLQSDATVAYGTGNTHRVATTDAERGDASNPYNTYVHPGLPVGPISNPGDVAIDAAIHPAQGDWLYFVTWNLDTGETIFSATYDEHEKAVEKWLKWMDEHPEYQ